MEDAMTTSQVLVPSSNKDCFEYRVGIEGEAAAAAARSRRPGDLIRLAEVMARLETANSKHQLGLDEDFDFHLAVARASHNDYFVSVLQSLKSTIYEGMLLARTPSSVKVNEKLSAINQQHRRVYDAIVAQDVAAAREAMRSHLIRCKLSTSQWYFLHEPTEAPWAFE
jgi:GntR family transcriptional regulator, transcriptional repressor for pyruvate dehydrogenase complex